MRRPKVSTGDRLAAALRAALPSFAGDVEAVALSSRTWTSITFAGERHTLRLRLAGAEAGAVADRLLADLTDPELDLPGHLLVDLALSDDRRDEEGKAVALTFSAVTVETKIRWFDEK